MISLNQNLILNFNETRSSLYLKGSYNVIRDGSCNPSIMLLDKKSVTFDTFFNSFSLKKWKKYTNIKKLSIELTLIGAVRITINEVYFVNNQTYREKETASYNVSGLDKKTVKFPIPISEADMIFIKVFGVGNKSILCSGKYILESLTFNAATKIAIGICTYKREEFLLNNLNLLRNTLLNTCSNYSDKFEVFVSDNGQTIQATENNSKIHIIPNKNLGGSAGFTRCMLEALLNKNNRNKYTHMLLMDDDIYFEPESLIRLYNFLFILKEEYLNAMIAFSMFTIENPLTQYTKGKLREGNTSKCLKANLNMSFVKNVLLNDIETAEPNFSGWWCHCIPANYITSNNLPFPFFIRCDDTEYGCRYKNKIITLNGLAIWHPSFEGKHPMSMSYYDMRNNLIFMTENINNITKPLILRELFYAYRNALYFEYDKALLSMQAVEDFIKGPDWLEEVDALALNNEIRKLNYKNVKPPQSKQVLLDFLPVTNPVKHSYALLSMLPFLPAFKTKYINVDKKYISLINVKKLYCYNIETKDGYYLQKNLKKAITCKLKYIRIRKNLENNFQSIVENWRNNANKLITAEFWIKKLELNINDYDLEPVKLFVECYPDPEYDFSRENKLVTLVKHVFPWYTKIGAWLRDQMKGPHFSVRSDFKMYFEFLKRRMLKFFGLAHTNNDMCQMRKYKNIHKGERCFITCTGPSLSIDDLENLKGEYTFGVNSITKAYPETDWRPTYYVLVDAYAYGEILKKEDVYGGKFSLKQSFFHWRIKPKTQNENDIFIPINYSNHWTGRMKKGKLKICDDPSVGVYDCFTVTNMAITIAAYMGFKDIYIVGADATYSLDKTHFIEGEWEKKHKKAQKDLAVAVQRSMIAYWRVKKHYNKKGVNIYNATRGGMLEIFPRADLDKVLLNQ